MVKHSSHSKTNGSAGEYWRDRATLAYYRAVRQEIESMGADAGSFLDVGNGATPVITWGDFETRHALNLNRIPDPGFDGVRWIVGNFLLDPAGLLDRYDLVTCLQVMEHLEDHEIPGFVDRLLARSEGGTLMVSVPWGWPKGTCRHHRQDPVTGEKFAQWFDGVTWTRRHTITDRGLDRAVFVK